MKTKIAISLLAATILISGCSQMPQNVNVGKNTKYGAAIGSAAGAVLGNIIGKDTKGTVTGAGVGAVIGSVIGYNMDKQAEEIAKEMQTVVSTTPNAEATSDEDIIITKNDRFVKITFRDKMMFPTDSSALTSTARYKVNKLTSVLQNYPQTVIQVVGHTDNRGSHSHNQTLSQNRASSVVNMIRNSGVRNQVIQAGCSFDKPIVPNTSTQNMSLNRRVEVFLYPKQEFVVNQCM